jgi:hypothetical protein
MSDSVPPEVGQQTCGSVLDTDRLYAEIRLLGFDRRQNLVMTYLIWFGSSRDAAFDARARAIWDGWRVTLHGDGTGWVARLSRQGPARVSLLRLDAAWVERFAAQFGGVVRGVAVEDLDCPGYWDSRYWDSRQRDSQYWHSRHWDSRHRDSRHRESQQRESRQRESLAASAAGSDRVAEPVARRA